VTRLLAAGALAVFLVTMLVIALTSTSGSNDTTSRQPTIPVTTATEPTAPTTTATTAATPVALTGAGAYDPEGDQHENDALAPLAVDGDPTTFWKTEHYNHGFFKKGVGLVLDAGRRVTLTRVVVGTDGSGSSARILLGPGLAGPFRPVSPVRPLSGTTSFTLTKGAAGRYIVVWITAIPAAVGEAHVTEVRAFAAPSG
jgi:hypothetical protein